MNSSSTLNLEFFHKKVKISYFVTYYVFFLIIFQHFQETTRYKLNITIKMRARLIHDRLVPNSAAHAHDTANMCHVALQHTLWDGSWY